MLDLTMKVLLNSEILAKAVRVNCRSVKSRQAAVGVMTMHGYSVKQVCALREVSLEIKC